VPIDARGKAVSFDNVRFGYGPDREVLKGLSFTAEAGHKTAIVGPSGAGKSTIARLILRFYDPTGGAVRIGGTDIRDATQESLRDALGVVPQDTVLFNDTVGYNIGYPRPDAGSDEIEEAGRLAQIHGFIESLPKGYGTVVGERGLKLSGGEKQRVAIARTVIKDPPILLLDEATSALDSETEAGILASLEAVAAGRTCIVIAHRLSTVVDADKIIVVDDGLVRESGSHAELLALDGLYARLWRQQSSAREKPELEPA
jgi:ATP-binding cassette subfamily B protein